MCDSNWNAGSFPDASAEHDFIRRGVDNDNAYFLLREKIHVGFQQTVTESIPTNGYFGSEVDLVADYAATSFLNFQAGYSHFSVGDYVRQSVDSVTANGGTVDANYFYVMMKFRF